MREPGGPISGSQIGKIIRRVAEKRGIQQKFGKRYIFHHHGFRRYWKHQFRMRKLNSVLLDYVMVHVLPYRGAYDRWTISDKRQQDRQTENYVSLRQVFTVTKDDVREEILKVLLGGMSQEDVKRISENLRIPITQIRSLL